MTHNSASVQQPSRIATEVLSCCVVVLIVGLGVPELVAARATEYPEPVTEADVSGAWLALWETGSACRLDLDVKADNGKMSCVYPGSSRRFEQAVRAIRLEGSRVVLVMEGKDVLEGDVVAGRFTTMYGELRVTFVRAEGALLLLRALGFCGPS